MRSQGQSWLQIQLESNPLSGQIAAKAKSSVVFREEEKNVCVCVKYMSVSVIGIWIKRQW